MQAVIFLYLLDNNTSFVVLGSAGVGTLIEFWKITKAVDVSIDRSGSIPKIRFKDKAGYSYASKPCSSISEVLPTEELEGPLA